MPPTIKHVRTATLDVAYEESGRADGSPVFLMHGWPYDPRCYDEVVPRLIAAGHRVIVPYLRGFGPTRFLSAETPRSGQQAALGNDLRELMDALSVERAVLAGYDWGGRAACIVAALWPERVRALVTVNGYNIQDIAASVKPVAPAQEHRFWYQYYFHTERGRAGLEVRRSNIRPQRTLVRQSGFCRSDDSVLPPSLRLCAGRSSLGSNRDASCKPAQNSGAEHCAARRSRWRRATPRLGTSCGVLWRAV